MGSWSMSMFSFKSSDWRCSIKKVFSKFRKFHRKTFHRKTPVLESFLLKVAGLQALKRDFNTGVLMRNLRNFSKHLFWRISAKDCFCSFFVMALIITRFFCSRSNWNGWRMVEWKSSLSLVFSSEQWLFH